MTICDFLTAAACSAVGGLIGGVIGSGVIGPWRTHILARRRADDERAILAIKDAAAKAESKANEITKQGRDLLAFLAQWRAGITASIIDSSGQQLKAAYDTGNSDFVAMVHSMDDGWRDEAEFRRLTSVLSTALEPPSNMGVGAIQARGVEAARAEILAALDALSNYVAKLQK